MSNVINVDFRKPIDKQFSWVAKELFREVMRLNVLVYRFDVADYPTFIMWAKRSEACLLEEKEFDRLKYLILNHKDEILSVLKIFGGTIAPEILPEELEEC